MDPDPQPGGTKYMDPVNLDQDSNPDAQDGNV
jgi:hypothetical protein